LRAAIEKRFGEWKPGASPAGVPATSTPKAGRVLLVDKPDALQTYFRFGGSGIPWTHADYPARYLANTILGGRFTSRLNQVLRVENGLTYGAGSGFNDALDGLFHVSTYTETSKSRACMELALSTYLEFCTDGMTQTELDSARNYVKGQYAPGTVETAEQSAGMLVALATDGLSRDVVDGLFARFDALTLDQVNATIRSAFPKREALSWVVIGQAAALKDIVSTFGAVRNVPLAGPGFAPRD
jgi:DNA-directed RNA polymerase